MQWQICSLVLAGTMGNVFGCFIGLAETLDMAMPEPKASLLHLLASFTEHREGGTAWSGTSPAMGWKWLPAGPSQGQAAPPLHLPGQQEKTSP